MAQNNEPQVLSNDPNWNRLWTALKNYIDQGDQGGAAFVQATQVSTDTANRKWNVTEVADGTTSFSNLPDRFILIMKLPSASLSEMKINLLGTDLTVKNCGGDNISADELASDSLVQFVVSKADRVAFFSGGGTQIASNMCHLNVNVNLQSSSTVPDPTLKVGLEVIATSDTNHNVYRGFTDGSGSVMLEVPADNYTVHVGDLDDYTSTGDVHLLASAIAGKTTVVNLTLAYNKGKIKVLVNFANALKNVASTDITGSTVQIKQGNTVVANGTLSAVSGVGTANAVGQFAPSTLFDATKDYVVQLAVPSAYALNNTSVTVQGSAILDTTYTVDGLNAAHKYGNLVINLQNGYTAAALTGITATLSKYDSGNVLQGTENVTLGTAAAVTKYLDGRYKYVIDIPQANWPAGFEIDAPITVNINSLVDTSVTVTVRMIKRRQTLLSFTINHGNSDHAGNVTYGDSAVGKTPGNVAWMNEWPFNACQPILVRLSDKKIFKLSKTNILQYENGTSAASDIASTNFSAFVVLPKFWYKFTWVDGNNLKVEISDVEAAGFNRFPKNNTYDYACKGLFEGYDDGSKLYSISGKTVTASKTIGTFRTHAAAQGTGFCQSTFEIQKALEILFVLYYKDLGGQQCLGNGNSNSSNYLQTGSMNAKNTGSLAHHAYGTTANTTEGMKWLWHENFWADYWEFVDGILINERQVYLQYNITQFADAIAGYTATGKTNCSTNGYVSKVQGDNEAGFLATTVSGSETTYYCDYYWQSTGLRIAFFGGSRGDGGYCGPFCWYLGNGPSGSGASICARLCYYITEAQYAAAS